jgi:hypothetical protein
VEAPTARRWTTVRFGVALPALADFSVVSSMAFTAVWIDLIAFIAVRLLA